MAADNNSHNEKPSFFKRTLGSIWNFEYFFVPPLILFKVIETPLRLIAQGYNNITDNVLEKVRSQKGEAWRFPRVTIEVFDLFIRPAINFPSELIRTIASPVQAYSERVEAYPWLGKLSLACSNLLLLGIAIGLGIAIFTTPLPTIGFAFSMLGLITSAVSEIFLFHGTFVELIRDSKPIDALSNAMDRLFIGFAKMLGLASEYTIVVTITDSPAPTTHASSRPTSATLEAARGNADASNQTDAAGNAARVAASTIGTTSAASTTTTRDVATQTTTREATASAAAPGASS